MGHFCFPGPSPTAARSSQRRQWAQTLPISDRHSSRHKTENADERYKQCIVDSASDDIVYSNLFTGVHGNYLRPSIVRAGMDHDNLPESDPSKMDFGSGGNTEAKVWKTIRGVRSGHRRREVDPSSWRLHCAARARVPRCEESLVGCLSRFLTLTSLLF